MLVGEMMSVLEATLEMNPEVLADIKAILEENSNELEVAEINRLAMTQSAFGGSEKASELGLHHGLAHAVITDTIVGMVMDLRRFRDGVQTFENLVGGADESTATDLTAKTQAVAALVDAANHSEGDRRYDESRNENVLPGMGPRAGQSDSSDGA